MIWKQANGTRARQDMVDMAVKAAAEFDVPVGIILGTIERESNFRLGLVSSAGAVGPCQFKTQFAKDYYRYAGFLFDLEGLDSIRGLAAVYVFYAELAGKRHGFSGDDRWRFALLAHRYGQNSVQAKNLVSKGRVEDVEACMRRNDVWYSDAAFSSPTEAASIAKAAAGWALDKVGMAYSQTLRATEKYFDCSSLVARAYAAQGVPWDLVGKELPTSTQEVYSDQFRLLWPEKYSEIGRKFGGSAVIEEGKRAGDLQFICTNSKTGRANRITHVTMVVDAQQIVHARGTRYGVRRDGIDLYAGKICAVLRYDPDAPLRRGMRGLRVAALQRALNCRGAGLKVDGVYGAATERAVKKYGEG